jgi:hypothetical protein
VSQRVNENVRRWRSRHPEVEKGRRQARRIAMQRLADRYPDEYRALYEEEAAARRVLPGPAGRPGRGQRQSA